MRFFRLLPRLSLFALTVFGGIASARSAGSLFAFGDSLVDNGNTPRILGIPFPPSPLYVGFRYSNGPTFAEYLPGLLGLNSSVGTVYGTGTNFGVGGALSGSGNITSIPGIGPVPLPGLADQITLFQDEGLRFRSRDLVAVWAGANDYFQLLASPPGSITPELATATVIQDTSNLESAARRLISSGARRLVFVNLPDLGKLPLVNSIANPVQRALVSATATQLSENHDQILALNLARVHAGTGANIFLFPADLAFRQIVADPTRYGFTNVTDAANANPALLFAPTSVQNEHLFWDSVHPTTAGHLLVARYIANMVGAPATLASQTQLMTYGVRGFGDLLYDQLGPSPLPPEPPPAPVPVSEGKGAVSSGKEPVAPPSVISAGPEKRWSIFVVGDYRQGSRDDRFNSTGFDYSLGNVAIGASYAFNPLISAGLLFGYGYNWADLNDGQGRVQVDAYQVGGFVDFHGPHWFAGGIASYGYDEFDQRRPGILGDTIQGQPNGHTVLVGAQGAYFWNLGDFSVGPIGSLTFTTVNVNSYSESGDPVLTQAVGSREVNDLFGTIGLRANYDFHLGSTLVQPYIKAEYEHEFLGDGTTIKSRFTAEPSLELDSAIEDSSQDYGRLGFGLRIHFTERFCGQLGFDALVGRSDGEEYTGNAGFSISF